MNQTQDTEDALWKCDKCGVMHEEKERVEKHIRNKHSTGKFDFVIEKTVRELLVRVEK